MTAAPRVPLTSCCNRTMVAGRLKTAVSVMALLTGLSQASSAESAWEYTLKTQADFTLTDNVSGVERDTQADFITSLTGSAGAAAETSGGTLNFEYQLSYDLYFHTDQLNGFRQNLTTDNHLVLVDDFLFLDVRGSAREQAANRSLNAPATSRTNENQTMILAGTLSPYIQTTIKNRVGLKTGVQYAKVAFRKPDVGRTSGNRDDETVSGYFDISSLDQDQRLLWGLSGHASANDNDLEQQGVEAVLRLRIGTGNRIIARGGYDRASGRTNALDIEEPFWRVGFEIEPVRDSYIRLEAGERYGGPSYDGLIRYDVLKGFRIEASYDQKLQTDQNRFTNILNGLEPELIPTGFLGDNIENPDSPYFDLVFDDDIVDELTINETARVTLSGQVGHTSYSLSGYNRIRTFEEVLLLAGPFETVANGASFSLSRPFGRRTTAGIRVQFVDEESDLPTLGGGPSAIDLASEIDSLSGNIYASFELSPTSAMTVNIIHSEREDQTGLKREENAVMMTITKTW